VIHGVGHGVWVQNTKQLPGTIDVLNDLVS